MAEARAYSKEDMNAQIDATTSASQHVRIDRRRLDHVVTVIPRSVASRWHEAFRYSDEHYKQPSPIELDARDAIQFALVSGSQGWLIWQREPEGTVIPLTIHVEGKRYVGPYGLIACHVRAIRQGQNILDPDVLANFTMADVERHYRDEATGRVTVQLLDERLANFREVGRVLRDEFNGHFLNVLKRADGYLYRDDGGGLMQLLVTGFPRSFGDWPMAKLPHVMVLGLLEQRLHRKFGAEIDPLLAFKDADTLEGGADYYRPWFFIRVGLLEISDAFKQKLRRRELIDSGSPMEREFRAFTIQAMRDLRQQLGDGIRTALDVEVETHAQAFLRCRRCRVGITEEELPCPYRAVCKATHEDHELMDCGWPLVMTTEY